MVSVSDAGIRAATKPIHHLGALFSAIFLITFKRTTAAPMRGGVRPRIGHTIST